MINAVIVENTKKTANLLEEMINSLFDDINIVGIAEDVESAINMINDLKPNLIFLDINLNSESGFDVLKRTNSSYHEVIVTTAYSEHAIEAIKNQAIDFVLKPYDFHELKEAILKSRKFLTKKSQNNEESILEYKKLNKVSIATHDGMFFVSMHDIIYIQADSNYSILYLKDEGEKIASKKISHFEKVLDSPLFYRSHKSYIVNLEHIKQFEKGKSGMIIMSNGDKLPVARNKKQELIDLLSS